MAALINNTLLIDNNCVIRGYSPTYPMFDVVHNGEGWYDHIMSAHVKLFHDVYISTSYTTYV